jgi:hypothetical protein
MSGIGGINAALQATATVNAGAATFAANQSRLQDQVNEQLTSRMKTTFTNSMDTVINTAATGTFDDPALAAEAAALRARLEKGTQQTGTVWTAPAPAAPAPGITGGGSVSPSGVTPIADATAGQATLAPTGTVVGNGAATAPATTPVLTPGYGAEQFAADQQALLKTYVRQATHRRERVQETLASQFPDGSKIGSLADAHSGDDRLVAKTGEQADAIAQRLAMDMTFAAADMEVAAAELELARNEESSAGLPTGTKTQAAQAAYTGARERVDRLSRLVKEIGGGEAIQNMEQNATGALDATAQNALNTAKRQGASAEEIDRMGALLEVVDEQATTGKSETLQEFSADLTGVVSAWSRLQSDATEREAERREQYRQEDEKFFEQKRADIKSAERIGERKAQEAHITEQSIQARVDRRRAQLQA